MKTIQKTMTYRATPEAVFDHLDDLSVTGMHMTKSSMPMMGGKMNLEFISPNKKGLNTKYRWTGKVLWMNLDFTVAVTKWVKGIEKSWKTIGPTKMIICSWFRMDLQIEPNGPETTAHLSITYEKPKGFFNVILSFLLANWYCRWCLNNMLNDTASRLKNQDVEKEKMPSHEIH
jgi:hypothetical protein